VILEILCEILLPERDI